MAIALTDLTPEYKILIRKDAESGLASARDILTLLRENAALEAEVARLGGLGLERYLKRALLPDACVKDGCGEQRFRTPDGPVCAAGHDD